MGRKLHAYEGGRRIPPEEVDRLAERARARGWSIPVCACGCGVNLLGRRPQTKWATDACRMRAQRRA